MVLTKKITVPSEGHFDIINITDYAKNFIQESHFKNGLLTFFLKHTTGALIITEHEAGIMADMQEMFEKITPAEHEYKHHIRKVDFNCHAHLRAILMQASVSVPVIDGEMTLGLHQEILLIDDQVEQKPRNLILQLIGE